MEDRLCFVQFLHPGYEPNVREPGVVPWNIADKHKRKFLRSPGTCLDAARRPVDGELVFWGEWEPQSRAEPLRKTEPLGPRWLHTPFYEPLGGWAQNTDPFVFGDRVRFSICQQHRGMRPTQLAKLLPGSVVLFGSGLGGEFRLDTVFVVAGGYVEHSRRERPDVDASYEEIVMKPYYTDFPDDRVHRLYSGATPEEPVDGMFSFFPCKTLNEGPDGFPRPTIRLPQITQTHKQSYRRTFLRDRDEGAELWREVVRQVEAAGLRLGVRVNVPERRGAGVVREPVASGSC
jgi:hypothetical protein